MAAAQPKAAMHVSGHMPGYNAAGPNVNFAPQDPQLRAPLSPLRLHALQPSLQPRPLEALDHMVGSVFQQPAYPPALQQQQQQLQYPPALQMQQQQLQPQLQPPSPLQLRQWSPQQQWAPQQQMQQPQQMQQQQQQQMQQPQQMQQQQQMQQPQQLQQYGQADNVYGMARSPLQQAVPQMRSTEVQWASGAGAGSPGMPQGAQMQGVQGVQGMQGMQMQGLQGPRPPPVSLLAGGGGERHQGSDEPPTFMRALADMHCGTSPQQQMMQEQKRQAWLRELDEQMSEQKARKQHEKAAHDHAKRVDEDEWNRHGPDTWWGKSGAGAPLVRDGVVLAHLKNGSAVDAPQWVAPGQQGMQKSLADTPVGGGGSYAGGGGMTQRSSGGGGGGGGGARRPPGQ